MLRSTLFFARILVFIASLASSFSLLCSHPCFHRFARILIFIASLKNRKATESIVGHTTHHPNVPPRLRKRYTCRKSYQCGASVITKTQQKRVRKGTINQTEKPRGFWTPLTFFFRVAARKKAASITQFTTMFLPLYCSSKILLLHL